MEEFEHKQGDLLVVKDVIQHWPNKEVKFLIDNILPNFKYVLVTNDYHPSNSNSDIKFGRLRAINLEAEPFDINGSLTVLIDYQSYDSIKRVYLYKNNNALRKN